VDFSNLSEIELRRKLDDAGLAARLEDSEEWGLFREALSRIEKAAQEEIVKVKASDMSRITELQMLIKICRNVLKNILNVAIAEGEIAFNEIKERNTSLD